MWENSAATSRATSLTVVAPSNGLVMKRMASLEGMAVSPGMQIFHIADLRSLWLSVEIFENQVVWVREGTPAEITLPYFPGKTFRGTVRYLEPEKLRQLVLEDPREVVAYTDAGQGLEDVFLTVTKGIVQ